MPSPQLNQRMDKIEQRMDKLEEELKTTRQELNSRIDKLDKKIDSFGNKSNANHWFLSNISTVDLSYIGIALGVWYVILSK